MNLGVILIALCTSVVAVHAQSPPPTPLPPIEVRGTTPLSGTAVSRDQVPANVQITTGDALMERGAQTLTDFLSRELAGVHTTQVQNNPFQPDVAYRGFVSSFLLGTPPGLSVFVDGVRVNEPLADQVNWDLIPTDAIARVELHPGSNPVYGRNTLGGAFVVQTKRGFTHPGTLLETWGGSFGRWRSLLQTGGSRGAVDYFLSGNFFTEEGFRDFSRSDVGQVFGKVGYTAGVDDLALSFTYVNNRLTGNGPLPESRLHHDRSAVFTHPDRFVPDLRFVNAEYQRELTPGLLLAANAYGRLLDVEQFNRDVEEDVQADTRQRGWGSAVQLSYQGSLFGLPLIAVVGADYNGATLAHRIAEREDNDDDEEIATTMLAHEEPDRFAPATKVRTYTHGGGAFLTATVQPLEHLAVTASGRVDVTGLKIKDRLAEENDELSASGSHRFIRVDPAVGATYTLTPQLNLYAGYSQSYRAPTAIELTCANPEAPCPIPTAIVDDPPLDPVKGKTWEAGVRWSLLSNVQATLAFFRTDLKDDILFRNEPQSRVLGFFQNVDATRRQGVEMSLQGTWSRGRWFANYTLTEATFEGDVDLFTFANADRVAHVQKGDSLPLVPTHRLNGGVEFALSPDWQLSFDGTYVGSQHLRGDEANQRGQLEPYFVANAQVTYQATHYEFFLRCENLFDNDYESYGAFFDNTLDGTGVERFLSPGPPFGVFAGARLRF